MDCQSGEASARPMCGRHQGVPSVCIADAKQHARTFLGTALEEFGFIVCECPKADELAAVLDAKLPDLVLIGLYQTSVRLTRLGFPNHLQHDSRWQTEDRLPWGLRLRCERTFRARSFVVWRRG